MRASAVVLTLVVMLGLSACAGEADNAEMPDVTAPAPTPVAPSATDESAATPSAAESLNVTDLGRAGWVPSPVSDGAASMQYPPSWSMNWSWERTADMPQNVNADLITFTGNNVSLTYRDMVDEPACDSGAEFTVLDATPLEGQAGEGATLVTASAAANGRIQLAVGITTRKATEADCALAFWVDAPQSYSFATTPSLPFMEESGLQFGSEAEMREFLASDAYLELRGVLLSYRIS